MSAQAFRRVAIVNRGEPAMRLINAVREWNAQGLAPLRTIAIYTAVDRTAMFVREADEAVLHRARRPGRTWARRPTSTTPSCGGSSPSPAPTPCGRAGASCRRRPSSPGCAATWTSCSSAPPPRSWSGSATRSPRRCWPRRSACRWRRGPTGRSPTSTQAREHAERIGYPLMIKATAGGGGRGIRKVERAEDLAEAFERASSEGAKTAGDATVFMERAIAGGRHVEVQVVADATGDVWTLGVRDCSRAAAQPEGARGVGLHRAGRRPGAAPAHLGRRAGEGRGLRQRGHGRVPLRAARAPAVVPGGQHPAAGGALRHRGHHRRRHRQAAAARRGRRQAGRDRPGDAAGARARDRGPAHRRGPRAGLRPGARPHRAPEPARRPGRARRHRRGGGRHHPAAVRLHDRQDHRVGPRPQRGPRAAVPRAAPDHRGDRRRHHEQGVPARPARPARGAERRVRPPCGSTR